MAQNAGDNNSGFEADFKQIWNSFNKLRLSGQLCDAVLKVGDRRFPVHRAILAAHSPYFRALFTNGMKETEQVEIEISIADPKTMEDILNYVYTRTVRITMDNVKAMLPQADSFMIQGLVDQCCLFLASTLHPGNCIGIMKFATKFYIQELAQKARCFLRREFNQVWTRSIEFLNLELEELLDIVSDDELNVKNEEKVWEAVLTWVEFKASVRAANIPHILPRIRLGLIHTDYFVDSISNHPYVVSEPDCQPTLSRAWAFLNSVDQFGNRQIELDNPLVRPRVPNEVMFVIGGWSGGSPVSYLESYDTRADRWYAHPTLEDSLPRAYHGMATVDKMVYVIGGFDGTQYYNNVRRFNPAKKEWEDVASMYSQRCYVSVAVAQGCVYACGGYDGRRRLDTAEKYDPQTNQWTKLPTMNCRRSDASANSLQDIVYIAGGFDGDHCLSSAEMYCPDSNQWTLIANMHCRRSGVSVISYRDCLYALGGFDGERRLSASEKYCPESGRWHTIKQMYAPRSNFASVVLDDMIFTVGGFNGNTTISNVECYDAFSDEWYEATDMNVNRSALQACVVSGLSNVKYYTHYGHWAEEENASN